MATKTWTGGTATWDNTNGASWSGGTVPVNGDTIVFDGTSGGGVVTVAAAISGMNFVSLTAGAFTGTLDFSVNNPNITFTGAGLNLSGAGSGRKFLMGTGTFTFTTTSAGTLLDLGTTTGLDAATDLSTATYTFTATTSAERQLNPGGRACGNLVISANTSRGGIRIFSANTFTSINVAAGTGYLMFPTSATNTITASAGLTLSGTSSNPILVCGNSLNAGVVTLSLSAGTSAPSWTSFMGVTTTGSGTMTATNSLDLGRNTLDTGDTITAPSVGGGGVIGVIGS